MGTLGRAGLVVVAALLGSLNMAGQTSAPDLRQILERLEGLERSNRELVEEVHALRSQLAATNSAPTPQPKRDGPELEEQVAVSNARIEEQQQTKVESGQRFPIRLKGMLLFNTFVNSKQGGEVQYPTVAVDRTYGNGGASLRQSVFGFDFRGPEVAGGGKLHASLLMDFFGGSGQSLDQELRVRTASMQIDWKNRSLMLGIDKPIFAPREPDSLAQVGISPLTGAGNLWMWIPQIRLEQSLHFSDTSALRAQIGVVGTREVSSYQVVDYVAEVESSRPGLEGRFELSHDFGGGRRVELAPGFHVSTSHVAGAAVPSSLFSMDWLLRPSRKLEFTGAFFTGQNIAHLGTGGTGKGFVVNGEQNVKPLHSQGGWGQFTIPLTDKFSFHLFGGTQDERGPELVAGQISTNFAYGANLFYHLAPNVIVGIEASQVRTNYFQSGHRLNNHYDLSFAYIF